MIHDFSTKIKSSNNKAKITFYVTLIIAALTFAVSFIIKKYSGLVGNVGLILIAVSVLVYTKYVAPEYYYDIMHDSEGSAVFVVRVITGKRQSTFCRIGLSEIVKIEKESAAQRKAHKTPAGVRKYSYTPTMSPAVTYRLTTRSVYERAEIIIEVSDEFAEMLAQYVSEARAAEAESE